MNCLRRRFGYRLLSALLVAASAAVASAQGILVRPMSVEMTAQRGKTIVLPFDVQNTQSDRSLAVDLDLQFLSQNEAGWQAVPLEQAAPADKAKFASCLSWLKLERRAVDISPGSTSTINVTMTVPSNANGFYSAGLIIATRPPAGTTGIGVVLRFLVPILIQIEGQIPKRIIVLNGAGVSPILPSESSSGMTIVSVLAQNQGQAMSRVEGTLDLYGQVGTQWLKVSSGEIVSRRILPNAAVRVSTTIGKRIPSGNYRVVANLKSDGQPVPKLTQELPVKGDPAIGTLQPDIPLLVNPAVVEVDSQPGALRSGTVALRNPGNDPVTVDLSLELPDKMRNSAIGDVKGEDYSGLAYTQIGSTQVVIGPRQERKIRISTSLPESAEKPEYFANLIAKASINGQSVGTTSALVRVRNRKVTGTPLMASSGSLGLSQLNDGTYAVTATFANAGPLPVEANVVSQIRKDTLSAPLKEIKMTGDADLVLPVTASRFNGILDPATLAPGTYFLAAICSYEGKRVDANCVIRVIRQNKKSTIQIVPAKSAAPVKK